MYKMSIPPSIKELVDNLVKQIVSEHERDKEQLREQITSACSLEIDHLKSKIHTLVQKEDNYKFQKRTIASLTSEISSLDARLKQANDEIRQLTINLRAQGKVPPVVDRNLRDVDAWLMEPPVPPVKEAESPVPPVKEAEPPVPPVKEDPPVPPVKEEDEESTFSPDIVTPEPELVPVVLRSGSYYWDPETNELYDYVSDELIGQSAGHIKAVKIRNLTYYLDPHDDSFYEVSPDTIGDYAGQIVNRKAIFTQK